MTEPSQNEKGTVTPEEVGQTSRVIELLEYKYKSTCSLILGFIVLAVIFLVILKCGMQKFFSFYDEMKTQEDKGHVLIPFTLGWFGFVSLAVLPFGKAMNALIRESRIASARHYLVDLIKILSLGKSLSSSDLTAVIELGTDRESSAGKTADMPLTPLAKSIENLTALLKGRGE